VKFFIILFLLCNHALLYGQSISGTVFEKDGKTPVEYVNIGIVGKNVGIISDQNGKYTVQVKPDHLEDTLRFSSVGYRSYSVKVADFVHLNNGNVCLEKRLYDLTEVMMRPKKLKQKTLGITTKNKSNYACHSGYDENSYTGGAEFGILIGNKETVFIKEINFNLAEFSFDTVLFRINIYKPNQYLQFENILNNPVYVSMSEQKIVKDKITIDLRHLHIAIEGDFLVTFELVKLQENFFICFCADALQNSYGRCTSQATWETIPAGMSISAIVDVEK